MIGQHREIQLMPDRVTWYMSIDGRYYGETTNTEFAHAWVESKAVQITMVGA
tara:strand:+ start:2640 stop:2795 length:156 start_codon:yes stop_codon:yes gene_type:complete